MGIGCFYKNTFLSILLYADDMALIAPSLKGLQKLLNATERYCKQWDILLNPKNDAVVYKMFSGFVIRGKSKCCSTLQMQKQWVCG